MTVLSKAFSGGSSALTHDIDKLFARQAGILHGRPHHHFRIHLAQSAMHRRMASQLVHRMFSRRGYQSGSSVPALESHLRTLVICGFDAVMGTLSIGEEQPGQLLSVEKTFPDEVQALRDAGHRMCEFTKLAVEAATHPKELLGSLFHAAYRYAHRVHATETVLVEVNPRHVRFYQRSLGFKVMSGIRLNARVNAPAVLLALDLAYGVSEMERLGGRPHLAAVERSFYPYFLSPLQEAMVLRGEWGRR